MKTRESNYDLLRTLSMIAVIILHVSAVWVGRFSGLVQEGANVNELRNPFSACVYNSISRFAVPCFIMLSGAFLLPDKRNEEYASFYKRSYAKIGIHTWIFTVLYVLYRVLYCLKGEPKNISELVNIGRDIVRGCPMYHMWYMYMLIGLYLLVPICVRFKNSIPDHIFQKAAIYFLCIASLCRWTTQNVMLCWDIGQAFEYLGYFMVGCVFRDLFHEKKNNKRGIFLISLGFLIEVCVAYIEYYFEIVQGIPESELEFQIVSPYSPLVVLASLCIFAGFSFLRVKESKIVSKLSEISFIIYLAHAGVWDFMQKMIGSMKGANYVDRMNNMYVIPVFVVVTLLISYVLSSMYLWMFHYLKNRKVERL